MTEAARHDHCQHRFYYLSCDEYDALWQRAGGCCELCRRPEAEVQGKLGLDHDHRYGDYAVRGLLCQKCNAHMGMVDRGERPSRRAEDRYCSNAFFVALIYDRHLKRLKELRRPGRPYSIRYDRLRDAAAKAAAS
jgi:hypothetical protein